MKIAALSLLASLLTLSACGGGGGDPVASVAWKPAVHRGGSNFNWYAGPCDDWWDNHHTIKRFREDDTINQLSAMYTAGQRSIGISVFYSDTAPESTGSHVGIGAGAFPDWFVDNLLRTYGLAKQIGFERFVLRFHPVGDYGRSVLTADQAPAAHNAMVNLVATIEDRLGILPYTNLCNECIEEDINPEFPAALWRLAHDDPDFGGRQFIGVTGGRFTTSDLEAVYGKHPPKVHGITLYNGPHSAALDRLLAFADRPIIVDESYFNSAETAQSLRRGTFAVGKPVLFVTQWPLSEAKACKNVDTLPLLDYGEWIKAGF